VSFGLGLVDDAPIGFAGEGVCVLLAEKADVVGLLEGFHRGRVGLGFCVVEADGADVLLGAVFAFAFFVTAEVFGDDGGGNREGDQDEGHHDDHGEEHEAGFVVFGLEGFRHEAIG